MKRTFVFVCLAALVCSAGCGSLTGTKGNVSERAVPLKADNAQVREFNKQLGEIKDETTAVKAVAGFVGYVDSRLVKPTDGTSIQSLSSLINPDVIKKIARKEAVIRGVADSSIMSDDPVASDPMLDIGSITDNINELGSGEGVRVNDEAVETAKAVVEGSIPNINPDGKQGITPLEAMVVGYAIVSGDDGTASSESVPLPADKVSGFVENITN